MIRAFRAHNDDMFTIRTERWENVQSGADLRAIYRAVSGRPAPDGIVPIIVGGLYGFPLEVEISIVCPHH